MLVDSYRRPDGGSLIAAPKPLQMILARQLASSLAMPIIIVDHVGTVIYWNEPAEALLAMRFDETGEIPATVWTVQFKVDDTERQSVPLDDWPLMVALKQRRPISRTIRLRVTDGVWRQLMWTSVPMIASSGEFLGVQSVFWEA